MNIHHGSDFDDLLPDPPDNLEFLELFTPEQQDAIALRFERGIGRNASALYSIQVRRDRAAREAQARKERREAAREAHLASRFNPVLRSRP